MKNKFGKPNKNKTGSIRLNEGKRRLDLIPVSAINALGDVLTYGLEKYEARNWEKGNDFSVPYASLLRHLTAWWDGEDTDIESSQSHLNHAIMNLAMLIEYEQKHKELDDRPKKD